MDTSSTSRADWEPSSGEINVPFIVAFDVLMILGFFLIAITLAPALISSRIRRMKTWFAMMVSGQMYCLSFIIIIGFQSGPQPAFAQCLLQTCLIYCAPILTASYTLAFIVELFDSLYRLATRPDDALKSRASFWSLVLPVLLYIVVFILVLVSGLQRPETIERDASYVFCHSTLAFPGYVTALIVFFEFTAMMVLEAIMFYMFSSLRVDRKDNGNVPEHKFWNQNLLIRTTIFSIYTGFSAFVSAFVLLSPNTVPLMGWVFMLTLPPIVAVLAFGTQADIYQFYLSAWRRLFENSRIRYKTVRRRSIKIECTQVQEYSVDRV